MYGCLCVYVCVCFYTSSSLWLFSFLFFITFTTTIIAYDSDYMLLHMDNKCSCFFVCSYFTLNGASIHCTAMFHGMQYYFRQILTWACIYMFNGAFHICIFSRKKKKTRKLLSLHPNQSFLPFKCPFAEYVNFSVLCFTLNSFFFHLLIFCLFRK